MNFINGYLSNLKYERRTIDENRALFIIRHTQLNPRHLFFIMKELVTARKDVSFNECVKNCTFLITREIFGAYRYLYPNADKISERFINGNAPVFKGNVLEKRFAWCAKRYLEDSFSLYRMFFDMGIMGKVTTSSDVYIEAEFQYNSLNPLSASNNDLLCIHPAFSLCFGADENANDVPIIPRGTSVA